MTDQTPADPRAFDVSDLLGRALSGGRIAACLTLPGGELLWANDACAALHGWSAADLLGTSILQLHATREDHFQHGVSEAEFTRASEDLKTFLARPGQDLWEHDLVHVRRDGTTFWVHASVTPLAGSDGGAAASVCLWTLRDISREREEQLGLRLELCAAICNLAARRDDETGAHLKRMALYSESLAVYFGLPASFVRHIKLFAPLHDIGKVGIPDRILQAPRRLSTDEFEIMKTHSTIGYEILKDVPALEMGAEIAHAHHERFDGLGYPLGLRGGAIPFSARIVSLADVYDALTSQRPYKAAWSHDRAVQEIVAGRGRHFDPLVVDAFLERDGSFLEIARSVRDEGRPAFDSAAVPEPA